MEIHIGRLRDNMNSKFEPKTLFIGFFHFLFF